MTPSNAEMLDYLRQHLGDSVQQRVAEFRARLQYKGDGLTIMSAVTALYHQALLSAPPTIEAHRVGDMSVDVVRDDLIPGGTKTRYLAALFDGVDEVVYASPAQGAAQIALAITAQRLCKRATVFVARRRTRHVNTMLAEHHGAKIVEVTPGYFNVVSARARAYANGAQGASLAPFGLRMDEAYQCITALCQSIRHIYDEVWCAAGSGTLACALTAAFPRARIVAVSVGHRLQPGESCGADVLRYDRGFEQSARVRPPFPCNMTYDAKAWEMMQSRLSPGRRVLFWNVDGDHTGEL